MNIEDLKSNWEQMHQAGLPGREGEEIQKIIGLGTSELVAQINKKLVRDLSITGFAAAVSALSMVGFYYWHDPALHPWIDISKLLPVQLLAMVLFLILFAFGWMEYQLVNRSFASTSVKEQVSALLSSLLRNTRRFMATTLPVLGATYWLELNYFLNGNPLLNWGGTLLLTAISFWAIRKYHQMSMGAYLADLRSYEKELE